MQCLRQAMKQTTFTHPITSPTSEIVVNSAINVLRVFVCLFMGRMSCDMMLGLLRRVLVEEACRKVAVENNGKVILSRVALLTGVRTQNINELADQPLQCTEADLVPEAMILSRWANDPRYRHPESDRPIDLLIYGTGLTFQRLVSAVAGRGVTTQTVLEKLERNGNISFLNEHWLRLENPRWRLLEPDEAHDIEAASQAIAAQFSSMQRKRDRQSNLNNTAVQSERIAVGMEARPVADLSMRYSRRPHGGTKAENG